MDGSRTACYRWGQRYLMAAGVWNELRRRAGEELDTDERWLAFWTRYEWEWVGVFNRIGGGR